MVARPATVLSRLPSLALAPVFPSLPPSLPSIHPHLPACVLSTGGGGGRVAAAAAAAARSKVMSAVRVQCLLRPARSVTAASAPPSPSSRRPPPASGVRPSARSATVQRSDAMVARF